MGFSSLVPRGHDVGAGGDFVHLLLSLTSHDGPRAIRSSITRKAQASFHAPFISVGARYHTSFHGTRFRQHPAIGAVLLERRGVERRDDTVKGCRAAKIPRSTVV